ncbi:hypothetical protein BCR42DRAFT_427713 [Absidia repens]|uniref:Uncharacterized protein n=1 Tax=Absidia repens TaxID=90262 RepID=A0A1X2HZ18_9FUNG|nr:hypothetical protein BCR42DRAFT_427713 [Absidia repens]
MVNSDYSIYQKPKSWISRLSVRARGVISKSQQDDDQVSIFSAPGVLPSPASSVASGIHTDDEDCSVFMTPSPSSSTSSISSMIKKEQISESQNMQQLQNQQNRHTKDQKQNPLLPPSPTLTAYDKSFPTTQPDCNTLFPPTYSSTSQVLPPLENNSYFSSDRPLPTKRRTPGRNRHSSIEINKTTRDSTFLRNNNSNPSRHSVALEQLAQDTLTYFVDTSPESSTMNAELCDKNDNHATDLVEKLKSRLTSSSPSVHPSVLKLAQDVMAYMNETPPLTNECQQLKPKLEVCLLIHGKAVN